MNKHLCVFLLATSTLFVFGNDNDYDDYDEDLIPHNSSTNNTLVFIRSLTNLSIDATTKTIRLLCEVQNLDLNNTNRVSITWRKNNVPVERNDRIIIRKSSSDHKHRSMLRINDVEFFDRGFYDCTATNGIDKIRSQALVDVATESGRIDSTVALKFDGEITTIPAGTIFDAKLAELPHERITNTLQRPYNLSEPFCQVYLGETCKDYLENQYVFVQPPYSQKDIELMLSDAFLVISQSNDISSSCNKFARPSLCYSAFPLCTDPKKVNMYQTTKMNRFKLDNVGFKNLRNKLGSSLRRICKEDCLLLETELCSKEYAIAKRHPVIGKTLELEECQFLPNETEASSRNCLELGVDHESVNKDDTCYWDNGELYRGVQNMSEFGNKCLRWAHQFHIHLSEHPELTGHNYCRNPGGVESQPFCYVDGDPIRRETCDVTKCTYVVWMYVIGIFIAVSVFSVVLFGVFCCRRRNKLARNLQNMNVPVADKNIYGSGSPNAPPMELNSLLPPNIPPQRNSHSTKNGYQNVPQYTYKEVAFVEELGEGAFGKVYKGELKTKNGKIFVAVKSLKENASAKTQADFQREIELISELKHPNIICLLGVVVKQEPMCMLFEFMSEGDLHEFLITNSPSEGKSLTQNQFLHIAIQIAQGMEYLSENHYVHRDLAARNCLVSKDLVVKISDFGLSRDMYSCDYYRVQSKSLLPVRWMPPESILYGKFTTESDVWSYGVVLWEIYSYGLQPYYGYNNQEVINMIRSRKLLPCPDACPSYCYALMVECWAELAVRRPSFGEISHRLRVWKQNGNLNGAYFKTSDSRSKSEEDSATWERKRHHESQSSLTSRTSSLGNKTQSTSLSNEQSRNRRSHRRKEDSLDRGMSPKNTVVNSNGDNFEIRITH
ncbi:tyrosine-protein kinase transmembrane receptor Ror-like [Tribolium madens]|uniref:tyrosine-protein kinase transmembrane receptor Ror-like n=1 Tax=Tribolium madens TaxID=41895 RepID=UPI001CF7664B|nr:tyrosine-protein kinase transmembrane receptor Ror-like [Tribolium madens]